MAGRLSATPGHEPTSTWAPMECVWATSTLVCSLQQTEPRAPWRQGVWQRLMPVRPVPVWCPDSETFSHRASRWSLTATLCPVLQMTAGSERARGLRAVIQGMAGLPPGLRAPCRPVTSVPICLVWTHPLLAPGSPPASALHLPRGPLTSLAPLPQCTPTAIRRPVAQVLTPSLGWSPPCGGKRKTRGRLCAPPPSWAARRKARGR